MKKTLLLSAILLCTVWMSHGQWTFTNLSSPKKLMGIATDASKAYFAGGHDGSNTLSLVESYDVEAGSWANVGDLSIARQAIAGMACGSKLFFGGGVSSNMATVYSTVDIYDIVSGQWSVQQLSVARFDISAVSHGNKVFFAGGCNFNIVCTNMVDIYDVSTGSWSTANLSSARAGMAYAVTNDLAVFAGGFINGGDVSDQVDIYNFFTDTWSTATLSEARVWASAVSVNDKIIIAGGIKSFPNVPSDRVDIFNSSDGTWTTASLSEARAWISAGAVNGKAYFAGGANIANGGTPYDFTAIVDIYNDADSTWTTDLLSQPRCSQGLAVGNHFLVAGGSGGTGLLSTVEIYTDPTLIHVPADYLTIQQGIEAADAGDTVLVAEDTYYENIDFIGKAILVASEYIFDGDTSHISNTIINGSQPVDPDKGSVVTFTSGEDTTSVLCGFTITGGTGTFVADAGNAIAGGGVFIQYSGGKLLNNYIEYNEINNEGWTIGGGVCAGGPITEIPWVVLRGNRINYNLAQSFADVGSGGGVIIFYNLIMTDNQLSYNEANGHMGGDGGGIELMGSFGPIELDISNNIIMHNEAVTDLGTSNYAALGGGMSFAYNCNGIIANNVISFNSVDAPNTYWCYAPGVFIQEIISSKFVFENNMINENISIPVNCRGGGLCLFKTGGKYQNNVLQNNSASHGGGIGINYSQEVSDTAILINNTITGNVAAVGGGIHVLSSNAVVINSIIWGNTATTGASINVQQSTLEVRFSDIEGDELWPGEGNKNEDPVFSDDAWHIDDSSPCYDAGIAAIEISGAWYYAPLVDFEGTLRPFGEGFDIGADEYDGEGSDEFNIQHSTFKIDIYPNPFSDHTTLSYNLERDTQVKISLYNSQGSLVRVLLSGFQSDGSHTLELDGRNLPDGVYYYRLTTDDYRLTATGKLVKY